jgi:hypothetical protein
MAQLIKGFTCYQDLEQAWRNNQPSDGSTSSVEFTGKVVIVTRQLPDQDMVIHAVIAPYSFSDDNVLFVAHNTLKEFKEDNPEFTNIKWLIWYQN